MTTVEMNVIGLDEAPKQSTGNRLKFKLESMMMLVMADRTKEAGALYDQLIEEFDKLA